MAAWCVCVTNWRWMVAWDFISRYLLWWNNWCWRTVTCCSHLSSPVKALLRAQEDMASSYKDYENRVLHLELQSMDDRYKILGVEVLVLMGIHNLCWDCFLTSYHHGSFWSDHAYTVCSKNVLCTSNDLDTPGFSLTDIDGPKPRAEWGGVAVTPGKPTYEQVSEVLGSIDY